MVQDWLLVRGYRSRALPAALLVVGLLLLPRIHALSLDRYYPIRLLDYFMPWLLVGLLPAALVTWFASGLARWRLFVTLPALVIALPVAPLFLPRWADRSPEHASLKVMSYNICSANRNIDGIVGVIRQEQPDLLLLEEAKPEVAQKLVNALDDLYPTDPLHYAYASEVDQLILSRYLLTPIGVAADQGRAQKVLATIPGGSLQVWNVHMSQPQFWSQHSHEFTALARAVDATDGMLIVGGDFNTTDQSEMYQLIAHRLQDSHWSSGSGFGFTYPASSTDSNCRPDMHVPWPMIRIDHIFHSPRIQAYQDRTLSHSGGSDHLPIVTYISLEKP